MPGSNNSRGPKKGRRSKGRPDSGRPQGGSRARQRQADRGQRVGLEKNRQYSMTIETDGDNIFAVTRDGARVYFDPPPAGVTLDAQDLIGRRVKFKVYKREADPNASGADKHVYDARIVRPGRLQQEIEAARGTATPDTGAATNSGDTTSSGVDSSGSTDTGSTPDTGPKLPDAIFAVGDTIAQDQYNATSEGKTGTFIALAGLGEGDSAIVKKNRHILEAGKYPELVLVSEQPNRKKDGRIYNFEFKHIQEAREFKKDGQFRDAKLKRNPKRPGEFTARVQDNSGDTKTVRVSAISLDIANDALQSQRFDFQIVNDSEPYEGILMFGKTRDVSAPTADIGDPLEIYETKNLETAIDFFRNLKASDYGTVAQIVESPAPQLMAGLETALTKAAHAEPTREDKNERTQIVHSYFGADLSKQSGSFKTRMVREQEGAIYAESVPETQFAFMRDAAVAVARLNMILPAVDRVTTGMVPLQSDRDTKRTALGYRSVTIEEDIWLHLGEAVTQLLAVGSMMEDGQQTLDQAAVSGQVSALEAAIGTLEESVRVGEALVGLQPESALAKSAAEILRDPEALRGLVRELQADGGNGLSEEAPDQVDALVARLLENATHLFAGHEDLLLTEARGGESYVALVEALRPHIGADADGRLGFMNVLPGTVAAGGGDQMLERNRDADRTTVSSQFILRRGDYIIDIVAGKRDDGSGKLVDVVYFDTYSNRLEKNTTAADYRGVLARPEGEVDDSDDAEFTGYVRAGASREGSHMFCTIEEFVQLVESGQIQFEQDPVENSELTFRDALDSATFIELIGYVQQNPRFEGSLSAIDQSAFSWNELNHAGDTLAWRAAIAAISRMGLEHARFILGDDFPDHPGIGMTVAKSDTRNPQEADFVFTLNGVVVPDTEMTLSGEGGADAAAVQAVLARLVEAIPVKETEEVSEPASAEVDPAEVARRQREALLASVNEAWEELSARQTSLDTTNQLEAGVALGQAKLLAAYVDQMARLTALQAEITRYTGDPEANPDEVTRLNDAVLPGVAAALESSSRRHGDVEVEVANAALDIIRPEWEADRDRVGALLKVLQRFTAAGQPLARMRSRFDALQSAHSSLSGHISEIDETWGAEEAQQLLEAGQSDRERINTLLNSPQATERNSLRPLMVVLPRHLQPWRDSVMQPFVDRGTGADPFDYTDDEVDAMVLFRDMMEPAVTAGWISGFTDDFTAIEALLAEREEASTDEVDPAEVARRQRETLLGSVNTEWTELSARQTNLDTTNQLEVGVPLSQAELTAAYAEQIKRLETLEGEIERYVGDTEADPAEVTRFQEDVSPEITAALESSRIRHGDLEVDVANEALDAIRPRWEAERDRVGALLPLLQRFTSPGNPLVRMRGRFDALQSAHANLEGHITDIDETWSASEARSLLQAGERDMTRITRLLTAVESSEPHSLRPVLIVLQRHIQPWRNAVMQPFADRGVGADPLDYTAEEVAAMQSYLDIMRPAVAKGWTPRVASTDFTRIEALLTAREEARVSTIELRIRERGELLDAIDTAYEEASERLLNLNLHGQLVLGTPLTTAERRDAYRDQVSQLEAILSKVEQYAVDTEADSAEVTRLRDALTPLIETSIANARERASDLDVLAANEGLDAVRPQWEAARDRAAVLLPLCEHLTQPGQPFEGMRSRYDDLNNAFTNMSDSIEKIDRTWTGPDASQLFTNGEADRTAINRLLTFSEDDEPSSLRPLFLVMDRQIVEWRGQVMQPFTDRGGLTSPMEYTTEEVEAMEGYARIMRPVLETGGITDAVLLGDIDSIDQLVAARLSAEEHANIDAGFELRYNNLRGVCHADNPAIEEIFGQTLDGGDQPFLMRELPTGEYEFIVGSNDPIVIRDPQQLGALARQGVLEVGYTPPRTGDMRDLDSLNRRVFGAEAGSYIVPGERLLYNGELRNGLRPGTVYLLHVYDDTGVALLFPAENYNHQTGTPEHNRNEVLLSPLQFERLLSPTSGLFVRERDNQQRFVEALDRGDPLFERDLRRIDSPELVIGGEGRLRFNLQESIPQEAGEAVARGAWLDVFEGGFDDVHQQVTAFVVNPDGSRGREVVLPYELYGRAVSDSSRYEDWATHRDQEEQRIVLGYEQNVAVPEPLNRVGVERMLLRSGFMLTSQGNVSRPNGIGFRMPSDPGNPARRMAVASSVRVLDNAVRISFSTPEGETGSPVQSVEMTFEQFQAAMDRDFNSPAEFGQANVLLNPDMSYWNDQRVDLVMAENNFTPEYLRNGLLFNGRPAQFTISTRGIEITYQGSTNVAHRMSLAEFEGALFDESNRQVTENARAQRFVDYYSIGWLEDLRGLDYELMMNVLQDGRQIGLGDLNMMYSPASFRFIRTELVGARSIRVSSLDARGQVASTSEVSIQEFLGAILAGQYSTLYEAEQMGMTPPSPGSTGGGTGGGPGGPSPFTPPRPSSPLPFTPPTPPRSPSPGPASPLPNIPSPPRIPRPVRSVPAPPPPPRAPRRPAPAPRRPEPPRSRTPVSGLMDEYLRGSGVQLPRPDVTPLRIRQLQEGIVLDRANPTAAPRIEALGRIQSTASESMDRIFSLDRILNRINRRFNDIDGGLAIESVVDTLQETIRRARGLTERYTTDDMETIIRGGEERLVEAMEIRFREQLATYTTAERLSVAIELMYNGESNGLDSESVVRSEYNRTFENTLGVSLQDVEFGTREIEVRGLYGFEFDRYRIGNISESGMITLQNVDTREETSYEMGSFMSMMYENGIRVAPDRVVPVPVLDDDDFE